jgi:hypothetical protein
MKGAINNVGRGEPFQIKSGRGEPHSKTSRTEFGARERYSVLECGGPPPLFVDR